MSLQKKLLLAIETSCDETAASVVSFNHKEIEILSNTVSSQIKIHQEFGGVVPEVASRAHLEVIGKVVQESLKKAKTIINNIDYFAVTKEPGLIGSLLIGITTAKTYSTFFKKPLIEVNHISGHFWSSFINENIIKLNSIKYPVLSLIVSGGHTQLVLVNKPYSNFKIVGQTLDDAAGEAFDKAAQLLNLGYPGGPAISAAAEKVALLKISSINPEYQLPIPMQNSKNLNFSFSGLKTALLYKILKTMGKKPGISSNTKVLKLTEKEKNIFAFSFQNSLISSLVEKTVLAAEEFKPKTVCLCGGVAANKKLRQDLKKAIQANLPKKRFLVPDFEYCTDNAAMIAIAAVQQMSAK